MDGVPSEMSQFEEKIEFEFETGKSYKFDASAEVITRYGAMGSMKSPGQPEITEIQ